MANSHLARQLCQPLFKKPSLSLTHSPGPLPLVPSLSHSAFPTRPCGHASAIREAQCLAQGHTHLWNSRLSKVQVCLVCIEGVQLAEGVSPEPLRDPSGLMKIFRQHEEPTVRAWTASHSCGDWILWASSRTAICGLGDKQTTLSGH